MRFRRAGWVFARSAAHILRGVEHTQGTAHRVAFHSANLVEHSAHGAHDALGLQRSAQARNSSMFCDLSNSNNLSPPKSLILDDG